VAQIPIRFDFDIVAFHEIISVISWFLTTKTAKSSLIQEGHCHGWSVLLVVYSAPQLDWVSPRKRGGGREFWFGLSSTFAIYLQHGSGRWGYLDPSA